MNVKDYVLAYGSVDLEERLWPVSDREFTRVASHGPEPVGAAVLIWNVGGQVLLVREDRDGPKGGRWATPGGFAREGESPEMAALREAKEEAGVEIVSIGLSKVVVCDVSSGSRHIPYYFFQFEGRWRSGTPVPGEGILEVRWFDELPVDMHFREDYVGPWARGR